ncbi:MAG: rhodanese-like domain-containing protein [Deltaproteobacteria bacterium]|nr:rhodanese-like domain-containing protein [Deltaproteobacteria bacterium]
MRTEAEFEVSHLQGARRVDPDDPKIESLQIAPDATVVVYCSVGYRSAAIIKQLHHQATPARRHHQRLQSRGRHLRVGERRPSSLPGPGAYQRGTSVRRVVGAIPPKRSARHWAEVAMTARATRHRLSWILLVVASPCSRTYGSARRTATSSTFTSAMVCPRSGCSTHRISQGFSLFGARSF